MKQLREVQGVVAQAPLIRLKYGIRLFQNAIHFVNFCWKSLAQSSSILTKSFVSLFSSPNNTHCHQSPGLLGGWGCRGKIKHLLQYEGEILANQSEFPETLANTLLGCIGNLCKFTQTSGNLL